MAAKPIRGMPAHLPHQTSNIFPSEFSDNPEPASAQSVRVMQVDGKVDGWADGDQNGPSILLIFSTWIRKIC